MINIAIEYKQKITTQINNEPWLRYVSLSHRYNLVEWNG